jgi:fibronectin type 3 domain-containing protein
MHVKNIRSYYYTVTAVNTSGASGMSNEAGVLLRPAAPANLTATATAGGAPVTLNWTAVTGATGYNVYRGSSQIGSTSAVSYSDTGVVPLGVSISYTITAVNAAGTSPASSAVGILLHPAAPAGLTAVGGNNLVTLNWSASAGAVVYRVFRSTVSGSEANPAFAAGLGSPGYTDTAAVNGTKYYYTVTAVNTAGPSGYSNEASATPASTAPASPTLLTATAATGGVGPIALTWTSSAGATVYRVFRSTVSGGEVNPAFAAGIAVTAYTDTSALTPGITYYYKVTAVNTGGASPMSNELGVLLSPAAPTNLTATAAAGGDAPVTLAWTASVGATGYNVYRASVEIGSTSTTGFSDTSVVPGGVTVSYTVTAVNAAGTSAASASAGALLAPATPGNLTATAGANDVLLNWSASAGATVYRVYRSTTSVFPGNPVLVAGLGSPNYTDTTASDGITYYYWVTAANGAGVSPPAGPVSATPGSIVPPLNLTASAAAGGLAPITLTWTASIGASFYRIYRSTISGGEASHELAVGITTTAYTDAAVSAGDTYYYKVTAVNNIAASAYSNEAGAALTPAVPVGLTATPVAGPAVDLVWTPSPGATSYNVYRGTVPGVETLLPTSPSSPTYNDTSVAPSTTYYYKVTAVNAGGISGYSNEVQTLTE